MDFTELARLQSSLRILQNMNLPSQQVMQMAHSAQAMADLYRAPALEAMQGLQQLSINSAKAFAELSPQIYETYANISKMYTDISPMLYEAAANSAKAFAEINPILQNSAINSVKFITEMQSAIAEITKNEAIMSVVGQKIILDYSIFDEAGFFPDPESLPNFHEYKQPSKFGNAPDDNSKAQNSINELKKQSDKFEPAFKDILQQTEVLPSSIQSEGVLNAQSIKTRSPFKRKISVQKAQSLCQKYKVRQIKHLYQNICTFSLSKLNEKNVRFFIDLIGIILNILPDAYKIYFVIFYLPLLYRLYDLINLSNASGENKNKKLK